MSAKRPSRSGPSAGRRGAPSQSRGPWLRLILFLLALLAVAAVAVFTNGNFANRVESTLYPLKYEMDILRAAETYGVDPYLVAAVAKAESGFDPAAVSSAGAVGLMQIMPDTAEWIQQQPKWKGGSVSDLTDPAANLEMGAYYLAFLDELFDGDLPSTLAAYNAGQGTVSGWLTRPGADGAGVLESADIPFAETREFVRRVEKLRDLYMRAHPEAFVT